MSSWQEIWLKKAQQENFSQLGLIELIKMNGYDKGAGKFSERQWRVYISQLLPMEQLIPSKTTVCEVGCGAGALLFVLHEKGIIVTGVDYSYNSIKVAKQVMPEMEFFTAEAKLLPYKDEQFDIVLSQSVFHYFKNLAYATQVLTEMYRVAKTGAEIMILDLPDKQKYDTAETYRRGKLSQEEYKKLYKDYPHLYYDKDWFADCAFQLSKKVEVFDQNFPGYGNSAYRFNVKLIKE